MEEGTNARGASGFELLEHQADLGIRAWGPSIGAAFEQAGRALADILGVQVGGSVTTHRTVEVRDADLGALLVRFLNALLAIHETEDVGFSAIRVRSVEPTALAADVGIVPLAVPPEGLPVKAATFHRLRVDAAPVGTTEVVVYLDV